MAELCRDGFTADQAAVGVHDYHDGLSLVFDQAREFEPYGECVVDKCELWEIGTVGVVAGRERGMDGGISERFEGFPKFFVNKRSLEGPLDD